jgi:hypothetical protein
MTAPRPSNYLLAFPSNNVHALNMPGGTPAGSFPQVTSPHSGQATRCKAHSLTSGEIGGRSTT